MFCQAETIQVALIVCLAILFVDLHLEDINLLQVFASVEYLLSNVGLSIPGLTVKCCKYLDLKYGPVCANSY
jgi:hypothetical protein